MESSEEKEAKLGKLQSIMEPEKGKVNPVTSSERGRGTSKEGIIQECSLEVVW